MQAQREGVQAAQLLRVHGPPQGAAGRVGGAAGEVRHPADQERHPDYPDRGDGPEPLLSNTGTIPLMENRRLHCIVRQGSVSSVIERHIRTFQTKVSA